MVTLYKQPVGKESIPEYDNATTPNRIMAANLVLEITSSQDIVIHMIALVIIIFSKGAIIWLLRRVS